MMLKTWAPWFGIEFTKDKTMNDNSKLLKEPDFVKAAEDLECEVAAIKAVAAVESAGSGFNSHGQPVILFEAHVFSRLTKGKYDIGWPDISSQSWNRKLYTKDEYKRLEKAARLDRNAALKATSWGKFQIMGFNYEMCGFGGIQGFVNAMYRDEASQLQAFVNFLRSTKLDIPLRAKSWAAFAQGYNGSGFKANNYDKRLAVAYAKFSK